jgi:hypothetical protein
VRKALATEVLIPGRDKCPCRDSASRRNTCQQDQSLHTEISKAARDVRHGWWDTHWIHAATCFSSQLPKSVRSSYPGLVCGLTVTVQHTYPSGRCSRVHFHLAGCDGVGEQDAVRGRGTSVEGNSVSGCDAAGWGEEDYEEDYVGVRFEGRMERANFASGCDVASWGSEDCVGAGDVRGEDAVGNVCVGVAMRRILLWRDGWGKIALGGHSRRTRPRR